MDQVFGSDNPNACFEAMIRTCEATVKIPKCFYSTWRNELGKRVIFEDDFNNIFPVDIEVSMINNKVSAKFGKGINCLKAFYNIKVAALVHLKFIGRGTFKMRFSLSGTPITVPNLNQQPCHWGQIGNTSRTRIIHGQSIWKNMVIPANVVKNAFPNGPSINSVKLPNGEEENWILTWSSVYTTTLAQMTSFNFGNFKEMMTT